MTRHVIRASVLLCVLALGVAGCGGGQDRQSAQKSTAREGVPAYSAEAFFKTVSYALAGGGPSAAQNSAFSPDGSKLLISSDRSGIYNAYALPVAGGDPEPLTASTGDTIRALAWLPDGKRFLYTADQGGNELNHVYVRAADGSAHDLTPGKDLKAGVLGWSGDGAALWIASNERNPMVFDLYRYDPSNFSRELVFENDAALSPAAVSPDGHWFAAVKQNSNADTDIYLIDISRHPAPGAAPTPKNVTPHTGAVSYGVYSFSADSRSLYYSTNENGEFVQAWSYDIGTGGRTLVAKRDWDVTNVQDSPSGRYRLVQANEDGKLVTDIVDQKTGKPVELQGLSRDGILGIRFSRDESKIAFAYMSSTSPANIYVADLDSGTPRRLTNALNPAIEEANLVDGEVVRYPSFDGLQIPAVRFRPRQASAASPVPAVVLVHGGPGGQSRPYYNALVQHLVNHGYAVLAANNRGSSGYGKTFYHMDDRKHGEVDLDDIVYAKRYLQTLDWVDPNKIGVVGGSYGGFMVGAALAFRPDAFKVGVDFFGVMNWVRTLKSIPPWWGAARDALYAELGDPATDEERLRRISPLFHAENIEAPLLVFQGKNDPRVLQAESDEIVAKVQANGVPVQYVVFPEEGHGFAKRVDEIKASDTMVTFLDQYLKGDGSD